MNYTLEQLKELASKNRNATVTLHRRKFNPKSGREIWDTTEVLALYAYKNLSIPFEKRMSGWQRIFLSRNTESVQSVNEFKLDTNSLSNPQLISQLESLGFVKKEVALPEVKEPIASQQMTDAEMLEYLKNKGAIHGKVKLKSEEPEIEPEPIIEVKAGQLTDLNSSNETNATA
jgi:hypothetical protein